MGEYAYRKCDNVRIKIGTMERMYYLRFEDKHKIIHSPYSVNPAEEVGLTYRVPFPDEDKTPIGEYAECDRGIILNEYENILKEKQQSLELGTIYLSNDDIQLTLQCDHGKNALNLNKEYINIRYSRLTL